VNSLVRHPFVDVGKFRFSNLQFFFVAACIYVGLEDADSSLVFTYGDFIKLVWYGVCYTYVGCKHEFINMWLQVWAQHVSSYYTLANLDWQCGTEVVAMKGNGGVCVKVAHALCYILWECQVYI
jgi:hypothetical protein